MRKKRLSCCPAEAGKKRIRKKTKTPLPHMLMCHKVTRKNLIDSNPLFRYYLTHTLCNFFVKPIDSDTSEEI